MKKLLFYLMVLPILCFLVACSDNGDADSGITISLTAANLTKDGYFDGVMYYKITSNSLREVTVCKAEESAVAIEIPFIVKIDGSDYKCTSIDAKAFYEHGRLASVVISNSVTSIGDYAFSYCRELTSLTISNSVTSIGKSAFYDCSGLTSLTIPNSVTFIGDYAFRNCSGLTSLTIPNSVTSIGNYAFYDCSGLTSLTIPNSVTSIGNYAFSYCRGLTSLTIPNSATSIGKSAFGGCSGLTTVHCKSTTPPKTYIAFEIYRYNGFYDSYFYGSSYESATLYVPKGSLDAYRKANEWSCFKNIIEE